jgi:hypothetical protein
MESRQFSRKYPFRVVGFGLGLCRRFATPFPTPTTVIHPRQRRLSFVVASRLQARAQRRNASGNPPSTGRIWPLVLLRRSEIKMK